MRIRGWFFGVAVMLSACAPVMSATLAGTGLRESLIYDQIPRWSVGLNFEQLAREMKIDSGRFAQADASTACIFVGYDIREWLMVYGTLGATTAKLKDNNIEKSSGSGSKFSVGIQANFWQTEIVDPPFMAGILMFKGVGEVARYSYDADDNGGSSYWNEFSLAFPLCFEVFTERKDLTQTIPYSLVVSLGPAISVLDGRGAYGGTREGFAGRRVVGVIGAVDSYISHNLSVGVHAEYFDGFTFSVGTYYHF